MNYLKFFKKAFLAVICLLLTNLAKAQVQDTTIYYYKQIGEGSIPVASADSADYFRIIPPFTPKDDLIEIKDYYKDGTVKFVGNGKRISFNQYNGNFSYSGQCISFYPSGKRKSIINYGDFGKEGFEYWYYPNGKMFKLIKNEANENRKFFPNGELIDFYDTNGAQICKDGFGNSIEYDQLSKETVMEGPIVNGKKEGAWTGKIPFIDSGKYVLVYKNDEPISGLGYDSLGKSYSFNEVFSTTEYINGPTNFISEIKKSLKAYNLPKADIDSAILSFIVDESGRLMQLSTLKPTTPELLKALKESLSKQPNWSPTKLYGVPLKTKVILALNISHGHKGNSYFTKLIYTLRPLYKEKELNISHLMSTYMNKNSIIRR